MVIITKRHVAASTASVEALCKRIGISSSAWIVEFWKESNGALLNGQVVVYSVGDIEERNNTFEVDKNLNDMIAVGDDSGGRLVMINKSGKSDFFLVDSGSVSLDHSDRFGSLEELLDFIEEDEGGGTGAGLGDIISTGRGKPSLEEVVAIKKMLGLSSSIVHLKAMLAERGKVVVSSVYSQKYKDALLKYPDIIEFR